MEKCIGCELCAGVCPAKCIYVRGADNDPDDPTSPGERFGFVYEINYLRCIHCDLCVEACPTEAITETKLFEFSFTNRQRRDLHQGRAARRRRRQAAAPAVGGLARGRGRAHQRRGCGPRRRPATPTSSASVGWSGELGYGVRAARAGAGRADGTRRGATDRIVADASSSSSSSPRRWSSAARSAWSCAATRCTPRSSLVLTLFGVAVHFVAHGGPLPRRRAGDRLRRRDRRAVPVRDHAARRRPGRGPAHRAAPDPAPAGRGRWASASSAC